MNILVSNGPRLRLPARLAAIAGATALAAGALTVAGVTSADAASCPNTSPGSKLISYQRTGNLRWTTEIQDTKADGHGAHLRVTIKYPGDWNGGPPPVTYEQDANGGCGTVTTYTYKNDIYQVNQNCDYADITMQLKTGGTVVKTVQTSAKVCV